MKGKDIETGDKNERKRYGERRKQWKEKIWRKETIMEGKDMEKGDNNSRKDMEKGDNNERKRGRDEGRRSQRMGVIKRMKKTNVLIKQNVENERIGGKEREKSGIEQKEEGGGSKSEKWD